MSISGRTIFKEEEIVSVKVMRSWCSVVIQKQWMPVWLEQRERGKDFPGGSVVKNPPSSAGDVGSVLGPRRFHMPAEHLYVTTTEACAPRAQALQ